MADTKRISVVQWSAVGGVLVSFVTLQQLYFVPSILRAASTEARTMFIEELDRDNKYSQRVLQRFEDRLKDLATRESVRHLSSLMDTRLRAIETQIAAIGSKK